AAMSGHRSAWPMSQPGEPAPSAYLAEARGAGDSGDSCCCCRGPRIPAPQATKGVSVSSVRPDPCEPQSVMPWSEVKRKAVRLSGKTRDTRAEIRATPLSGRHLNPVEHPGVQQFRVPLAELLVPGWVAMRPNVQRGSTEHVHNVRAAPGPGALRLVEQVVEFKLCARTCSADLPNMSTMSGLPQAQVRCDWLNRPETPLTLSHGGHVFVKAGNDGHVTRPRFGRHPGVRQAPRAGAAQHASAGLRTVAMLPVNNSAQDKQKETLDVESQKHTSRLRSAIVSTGRSALRCLRVGDSSVQLSDSDREELVVAHRYLWISAAVLAVLIVTAVNLLPKKFNFPIHPSVILLTVPASVCIIGMVTGCCLHARVYQRNCRHSSGSGHFSCCCCCGRAGRGGDRDGGYLLQPMVRAGGVGPSETQESLALNGDSVPAALPARHLCQVILCQLPHLCQVILCQLPHLCQVILCQLPHLCQVILCQLPHLCQVILCQLPYQPHLCQVILCQLPYQPHLCQVILCQLPYQPHLCQVILCQLPHLCQVILCQLPHLCQVILCQLPHLCQVILCQLPHLCQVILCQLPHLCQVILCQLPHLCQVILCQLPHLRQVILCQLPHLCQRNAAAVSRSRPGAGISLYRSQSPKRTSAGTRVAADNGLATRASAGSPQPPPPQGTVSRTSRSSIAALYSSSRSGRCRPQNTSGLATAACPASAEAGRPRCPAADRALTNIGRSQGGGRSKFTGCSARARNWSGFERQTSSVRVTCATKSSSKVPITQPNRAAKSRSLSQIEQQSPDHSAQSSSKVPITQPIEQQSPDHSQSSSKVRSLSQIEQQSPDHSAQSSSKVPITQPNRAAKSRSLSPIEQQSPDHSAKSSSKVPITQPNRAAKSRSLSQIEQQSPDHSAQSSSKVPITQPNRAAKSRIQKAYQYQRVLGLNILKHLFGRGIFCVGPTVSSHSN
uniref:Pecanex-like protein n=1 Tax=Macrostomum lignano TaxID=282301 RepID=A0A1I8IU78_9PLAT